MLPNSFEESQFTSLSEYTLSPSLSYRLDFINKRIMGTVDELDAVYQFVVKVLSTDKYAYVIYDWYYGNELLSLVGKDFSYVKIELPRIIEEALLTDARISSVENFEFKEESVDSLSCKFDVKSIFGSFEYELEVAQ